VITSNVPVTVLTGRLGRILPDIQFRPVHFPEWAGENQNFQPFESLGKMLILAFFGHFYNYKQQKIDYFTTVRQLGANF
jgi:hypothetical protein